MCRQLTLSARCFSGAIADFWLVQRESITFWFSKDVLKGKTLNVNYGIKYSRQARHIFVDSTGVQVNGVG